MLQSQQRVSAASQLQCHRAPSVLTPTTLRRVRLRCRCSKDSKTTVDKKEAQNLSAPSKLTPQQLDRQQQQLPEVRYLPPNPTQILSTILQRSSPYTQEWRIFDFQAYQVPWDVPWGNKTVAATMATWLVGFAGTAFLIMPFIYTRITGVPLWELGPSGQADFALWSEIVESVVTFGILAVVAAR